MWSLSSHENSDYCPVTLRWLATSRGMLSMSNGAAVPRAAYSSDSLDAGLWPSAARCFVGIYWVGRSRAAAHAIASSRTD